MDPVPVPLHTITINNGQKIVMLRDNTSLLAGFARNNIFIPSACGGKARCGYCKVHITKGAVPATPPEEPFISEVERARGVRLSCQVKAHGNLSVSLPDDLLTAQRCTARLDHKELLTYDIVRLTLEMIKPAAFSFTSGQYVQLRSQPYDNHESVVRNYSLASPPSRSSVIDLIIRKVPGGISTGWIFDHVHEGDTLYFTGPFGRFRLSNTTAPILFIAGGSGMGPIYSILMDMQEHDMRRTTYYFFGALTQRDLFLMKELRAISDRMLEFTFIPALSNEPADSSWTGERGIITDVVARYFPDCSDFEAYLCGSPGMISACKTVLLNGNIPAEHIFYDVFA
jgi:Na+-transporting NADH:ubiquinone oxidoreductase subunit F